MRLGVVILPEHPWRVARESWKRAEDLGFDHAWTYDHLTWRTFRDSTWFGSIPTLTAAAAVTSRIRIGPLVASPNFRHPVPFAKELVTLDDVSDGRLILGLGAGGTGWDSTMLGHDWSRRERAERFEEFVELLDFLLVSPEASYEGTYYTAQEARTYPGCVQRPRVPFAIAAVGRRAMRVAAVHGQLWVTVGDRSGTEDLSLAESVRILREQTSRLEEVCTAVGRDPSSLRRLVLTGVSLYDGLDSPEAFTETKGCYEEIGVTDLVVHWPRDTEPYRAEMSAFERIFA